MPNPVRKMQKASAVAQASVLAKIPPELLDQFVQGPMTAEVRPRASPRVSTSLLDFTRSLLKRRA